MIWETIDFAGLLGTIAEDQLLTRCAQVCFAGAEEDQAEQHDQGTIDEVLEDQDVEEGGNVLEEADREADLLEQMILPGHQESQKERLASWLRLPRRARVAIRGEHRNLRHLTKKGTRADVTCCPSSTKLYQCRQGFSMSGMRQYKAETSKTQSVTTSTFDVQSRSGSRCVRDS